jgi:hypothetical protein
MIAWRIGNAAVDKFIEKFPSQDDGDLILCPYHGAAYQKDRNHIIKYDDSYFNKCASYEDSQIALDINRGRIDFVEKHYRGDLLDIGIGCGEFIKKRPNTYGYDVNPAAIQWLLEQGIFRDVLSDFYAFAFWDVLEHIENPADYFLNMNQGSFVFVRLPIFTDLLRIRESKHYRPGEHLYYWTRTGFTAWMSQHGLNLIGMDTFEMKAGRESIYSFAFRKA